MFSSLITVTGPTVIAPILRNMPLKRNTATILKWEGILIDPIGAILAVLIFQFILTGESGEHFTLNALSMFIKIILIAGSFGFTAAHVLKFFVNRKLIPQYLLNVFTLALTLSVFVFSDLLAKESGLLAVVTMGLVLGNLNVPNIKGILDFKESISVLLISVLFIILSARIDIEHIRLLYDIRVLFLFLLVLFLIRPFAVMISSINSKLSISERIFISLTGPRGIVAAGIASLFGIRLVGITEDSEYITPLVFMVVLGTVIFSSVTGRILAKLLRILDKQSEGFMIIGAHSGARLTAKYLQDNNKHVVLLDNSQSHVDIAKKQGLTAFKADVYSDNFNDDFEFLDIGYLLALTPSSDLNKYVIKKYGREFGENGSYRLITDMEYGRQEMLSKDCAFSCYHDYNIMAEIGRDHPYIHEYEVESKEHFQKSIKRILHNRNSMPLFINDKKGSIRVIPSDINALQIKKGDLLVYMGKQVEELTKS
jgi:NhaP-type Na+/H+ or K+/H+ antiporter